MTKHAVMSPGLIGIVSVGTALAGMMLTLFNWTDGRIERLDGRIDDRLVALEKHLDQIEQNQAVLLERTKPLDPSIAMAK